jgi:hypothetical protein
MELRNATIRVHIAKEYWDYGVLWPFFEASTNDTNTLPIYFRVTNCAFDRDSNCYVFRIPFLLKPNEVAEVFIPRECVRGLSVQHDVKSSNEEMRKLGFSPRV